MISQNSLQKIQDSHFTKQMIKKDFIDKCANYCKNERGAKVLHAESVRKINDNTKGNKKRVLVITNQFITYFKEQKQVKPDHLHYWRNVSSFDINEQTVIIKFEKDTQLRFIHPNIEEVKAVLLQLFLRTFSSEELGPLDLSHFPHPPISVNARGIISRFDTLFRMDGRDPKIPVRNFFEQFLLKKSKYIRFDKSLEIDDVLPLVLEALRPLPYVQYISLPEINEAYLLYEALTQFVSKNSELKMLALHNNVDDSSSGFLDAFRESPVSQLRGITFEDVEFNENELIKVRDLSIARQFTSASFINSIPKSLHDTFNTTYLSNELMNNLRYLSLDRTPGINIKKLVKRIQALSVISLANCELEIADVLEEFGDANLENLRFLNLSGNNMNRSTSAQIPKYLERFHVSNVSWGEGILPQFLQYFLSQTFNAKLKLNCSSAQEVSEDDWDEVSNAFSSLENYPLEEFSWSNNKVSESLITYLAKNHKLKTLFFSNCFDVDQDYKAYKSFCESLPEMESLSNLVIAGSDGMELRDQISELLEALKEVKSLNLLIIDGNKIKDDGIDEIKELVSSNNSLHTVSFDYSYTTTTDSLHELVEAGRARRRPLHISWPLHDINRLYDANLISNDELQILKKDVTLLSTGRGNVVSDAQWLQAFSIQQQQAQIAASQRNVRVNRGSVRIKNNQVAPAAEPKKEQGRKVRAGSFRGLKRPSLLATEKSPTEEDPNLWINEPFEMFFIDFNDDFPLFLTEEISDYFDKYPLRGEESTDGKKHKHHSSKHHSSKHHHSKHHSSKHHSSNHHSSKHHHHHHKEDENEDESKSEAESKNEIEPQNDNDLKKENEIKDEKTNDEIEEEVPEVKTRDIKVDDDSDNENNKSDDEEVPEVKTRDIKLNDDNENIIEEEEEEVSEVKTRDIKLNDDNTNDNANDEEVSDVDNEDQVEARRRKRDQEEREKLEREEQEQREKEKERLDMQKDREMRKRLEKEQQRELEIENQRLERERKRKEKENQNQSKNEREPRQPTRERENEPSQSTKENSRRKEKEPRQTTKDRETTEKRRQTRDVPLSTEKRSSSRNNSSFREFPDLEKLNSLFENIQELEPIEPPRNMFLYVDPYGRPVKEPIKLFNGTQLCEYNPDPLDLMSVAPPNLNKFVSTKSKPQPTRNWPSPEEIDRSSLENYSGELAVIHVDELVFEDLPGFDDEGEDFDDDDEGELEKPEKIEIHRRERDDNGAFRIPEKRFPVFPLINASNADNGSSNDDDDDGDDDSAADSKVMPINWDFQLSQVTKIGNYKFVKKIDQPLEQLCEEMNNCIKKDSNE